MSDMSRIFSMFFFGEFGKEGATTFVGGGLGDPVFPSKIDRRRGGKPVSSWKFSNYDEGKHLSNKEN